MAAKPTKQTEEKRSFANRLLTIFRGKPPEEEDSPTTPIRQQPQEVTQQVSSAESAFITKELSQKGNDTTNGMQAINVVESVLKDVEQRIGKNRMAAALAPEITKAKTIYTGSILSPNDMQTEVIKITLPDKDKNLSDEVKNAVLELINDHFNQKLGLGYSVSEWIENAALGDGSYAVAVLPNYLNEEIAKEITTEGFLLNDEATLSLTDYSSSVNDKLAFEMDMEKSDCEVSYEQAITTYHKLVGYKSTTEAGKKTRKGQNIDIHGDIGSGAILDIKTFLKQRHNTLNPKATDKDRKGVHMTPIILNLPSHAVLPVSIPGSPREHIGYYVVLDRLSRPVEYREDEMSPQGMASSSVLRKAYEIMVDQKGSVRREGVAQYSQLEATSKMFELSIRRLLEEHLQKQRVVTDEIGGVSQMSNCVMYYLLMSKKFSLVYIPANYLVYTCFQHRPDGTGKSYLEDIETPLTIRNVLYVANVMAAVNNAANDTKITVTLDNKVPNVEKLLETIKTMYLRKRMLKTNSMNPTTISRQIVENSVSITPKGLPGLENFDIESAKTSNPSQTSDPELIQRFDDMVTTGLHIPYSAVNDLSEREYARSLPTINLFFADFIKKLQWILTPKITKFVRLVTMFDQTLRNKIAALLTDLGAVDEVDTPTTDVKDKKPKRTVSSDQINAIISNLTVVLPKPRISANRSQFEDIESHMNLYSNLLEMLFSSEMLAVDDPEAEKVLTALRRRTLVKLMREFIDNLSNSTLKIPDLLTVVEESIGELANENLMLENLKVKIQKTMAAIRSSTEEPEEEEEEEEEETAGGDETGAEELPNEEQQPPTSVAGLDEEQ